MRWPLSWHHCYVYECIETNWIHPHPTTYLFRKSLLLYCTLFKETSFPAVDIKSLTRSWLRCESGCSEWASLMIRRTRTHNPECTRRPALEIAAGSSHNRIQSGTSPLSMNWCETLPSISVLKSSPLGQPENIYMLKCQLTLSTKLYGGSVHLQIAFEGQMSNIEHTIFIDDNSILYWLLLTFQQIADIFLTFMHVNLPIQKSWTFMDLKDPYEPWRVASGVVMRCSLVRRVLQ